MSEGRTLWQMFADWRSGPQEQQYFNPLKAKIGRSVTIDDIDWRDRNFMLREFRQYKRTVEGRQYLFADYVLVERNVKGDETTIRVRLNPTEDPAQELHALLLELEDDRAYDEGLHGVLQDPSGIFRIEQDGKVTAEFTRLHGLTEPYKAVVTILRDENKDGRVDKDETDVVRLEYWDFERDVADAAGQPEKEYLFVELNKGDGWFQMWRGKAFDPRKVAVM